MARKAVVILVGLLGSGSATIGVLAKKPTCPEGYQRVPLTQVASLLKDFAGCKVEVEGQFISVMDQEMAKAYKTFIPTKYKDCVLFLIGDDGGNTATVAATKDAGSAVFSLAGGVRLQVKGIVDASAAKSSDWNAFRVRGRQEQLLIDMQEFKPVEGPFQDSPFPPSVGQSQPQTQSVADKLQALQELKDKGLISDEEYQKKRKELLEKL